MHELNIDKDGGFKCTLGSLDLEKAKDLQKIGYDATFKGVASTEKLDRQDQTLLQKGLNFDIFKKYGYFNDNHGKGTCVAEATGDKAWYDESANKWLVKGRFLPYVEPAKQYVDFAKSFAHNGNKMHVRLSVEGKIVDISNDGKIVKKADIHRVAITLDPINSETYIELLAKALGQEGKGLSALNLIPEQEREAVSAALAKKMNIDIELAKSYYDRYLLNF